MSSKKLRFSFDILFLLIDIEPIFFRYHPNTGIINSSFFKIKTGELKIVCKKKVSNIDWCEAAIKNFLSWIIFSLPLIMIVVDKKMRKQKEVQKPISFPPSITIFWGKKYAGINMIEMITIPKKKKRENRKFLIILFNNYIKSVSFCLFLIILILDPLISTSAGFGLTL